MKRFDYRVWDTQTKRMMTGNEVLTNFATYVENDRYIVMESTGYKDKYGQLIFEGDYIAKVWHNVKGVCSYTVKEIEYDEKYRCLGERYLKSRVVYHDQWRNDTKNTTMLFDLSITDYGTRYQVIGNRYEQPNCVEVFRPNYKDVAQNTGWVDRNGNDIYEYHALLLPDGKHRVVEFNSKYTKNINKFFLRPFENPWGGHYTEHLLTEELAKECLILTHTFLDEPKKKVNSY